MTKILLLVAGGSSSGAHRRHAEDGTIFDLLCRSVLVVRAGRDRVAREGCGAVRVRAVVQRKGAGER